MDDTPYVIGLEPVGSPNLNRKAIRGNRHAPVRFQETLPRGMLPPLRRGIYTVPFQDIFDRAGCRDVTEIGERALHFGRSPRREPVNNSV